MAALDVSAREERGRAARKEVPRAAHAALELPAARDPLAILEQQSVARVPELVPIRYGRMLVSPFAFYRGAAAVMAADLASTPVAGLQAQLCGDAHLANFGGFASPERELVFDLNDFDETLPGPFEWDVKRLAASFAVAARDAGLPSADGRAAVLASVRAYREAMHGFAAMENLGVWYSRLTAEMLEAALRSDRDRRDSKTVERSIAKARTKDSLRALAKLTHVVDGEPRIVSDPPLVVPIDELVDDAHLRERAHAEFRKLVGAYGRSLARDRRRLLESYRYADLARKVVGVGSVGTRAWIVLLLGRDNDDPLFLQAKEADASVLEPHLGRSEFANHGERVVEGQRLMQAAGDIMLGWLRSRGLDGAERDFYLRQLWDWKISVDVETMRPRGLVDYARMCGWTLARAHARSGDRIAISSYLGKGDSFDRAIAELAERYADVTAADHAALREAVRSGRIAAEEGV